MFKKIYIILFAGALFCSALLFVYLKNSGASVFDDADYDEIPDAYLSLNHGGNPYESLKGKVFETWLRSNLNTSLVPSVVTGIVAGNKLVYSTGVNADISTKFCVASLTKTFTAILALTLQENGLLSLDDPVKKFLPGVCIERKELESDPVTVRHLLSHTSGMHPRGIKYITHIISGKEITLPEQINPAGYWYAYSNDSYVLMKHVIEAAAGRSYGDLMREKIFRPLGMTESSADDSNGTGGITTNMKDLAKFASMLINRGATRGRRIMDKGSYRQMLARNVELPSNSADYYYSLGWEVISVNCEVDSFYKAGRWYGGASCVQVFPRKGIALLYLCNPPDHLNKDFMAWRQTLTGNLRQIARQVVNDPSLCTEWPKLSPNELQRYEGVYGNILSGRKIKILFINNGIYTDYSGPMQPLNVFTSNRLIPQGGNAIHNFVWRDGRVIGLALSSGWYPRIR